MSTLNLQIMQFYFCYFCNNDILNGGDRVEVIILSDNILGKRMRWLREKKDLKQNKVAEALGVSSYQLSRYESGKSKPDPELIAKIADFYNVKTDYLLGRTDNPNASENNNPSRAFHNFDEITDQEKEYLEEQLRIFRKLKDSK